MGELFKNYVSDLYLHMHICLPVLQLQIISAWISDLVLTK